jgi:ADP-ribosyl-[dinitrogen reductase] hydrolase
MLHVLLAGQGLEACQKFANTLVKVHPQFRFSPYPGRASGYIVDTMQTVLHHFLNSDNFEDCVVATVNCGEDADTTGAIVGMLAGALYGVEAIPQRWLNHLDISVKTEIEYQTKALLKGAM